MATSPVLFVYYPPLNDDSWPGVPGRHITEADWASFTIAQRRTIENATTQEGYTRRKVWVHRDLVDETEEERAQREAAEAAARAEYDRKNSLVRYGQIETMISQLEVLPPAEEFAALRADVDAVADVPPRVEAVETALTGKADTSAVTALSSTVSTVQTAVQRVAPAADPANNQFIANIAGQRVWIKLPHIDPTSSAFGLSPAKSEMANVTALVSAANAAVSEGIPLVLPIGEFPLRAAALPSGVILEGKGTDRTVFVRSGYSDPAPVIGLSGTLGAAVPLASDAAVGDTSVITDTHPGVAPGDVVYLVTDRNPNNGVAGKTAYQPDQDVQRVVGVTGSGPFTVSFAGALAHPFQTAHTARLQKMTAATGRLAGFGVVYRNIGAGTGVQLQYTDRATIEGVAVTGWTMTAGSVFASLEPVVVDVAARDPGASGNRYVLTISNGTRQGDVRRVTGTNTRGTVRITSGASYNAVTDCWSVGGHGGFDTHGQGCRGNVYTRCRVQNSSNTGFNTGSNSYGPDYGTEFDSCEVVSPVGGVSGLFKIQGGAPDTVIRNGKGHGGSVPVYIENGPRFIIDGGAFGRSTGSPIRILDTVSGTIRGAVIDASVVSAVHSTGASDRLIIEGNHHKGVFTLAGTNNVTANNVELP